MTTSNISATAQISNISATAQISNTLVSSPSFSVATATTPWVYITAKADMPQHGIVAEQAMQYKRLDANLFLVFDGRRSVVLMGRQELASSFVPQRTSDGALKNVGAKKSVVLSGRLDKIMAARIAR